MKKQTFTITIHQNQGRQQPFACEISEFKVNKIIEMVKPEITKKKKKMTCSSVKLDEFFIST